MSSATIPVPSLPYAIAPSSYTAKAMPLHELLRFLRDGARAIRAFCRPYPVKVVGFPADIQFDIGKVSFKVKVRVTAADAPHLELAVGGKGESLATDGGESMPPTEIFIPLVHFASDDCVNRSDTLRDRDPEDAEKAAEASGIGLTDTLYPTFLARKEGTIESEGYALQVKVSEGRVEIDESEQLLRWFYAVPVSGEKELSIELTRVGGAINWPRVTRRARMGGVQSRKVALARIFRRMLDHHHFAS